MQQIIIKSGQGDYSVNFFNKISDSLPAVQLNSPFGYVIDRKVFELHRESLLGIIQNTPYFLMEATEEEKTIDGVKKLTSWLQEINCTKQSSVCAIGGGIIQDIVSFTAHIYYRGLKWCFYPTTVLSMSDSCIGAKCGVNHNNFKNQLGAFHSPSQVMLCEEFVDTLSNLDVSSGYGEILKLYLTAGSWDKLSEIETIVSENGLRNSKLLLLFQESLKIKKEIIEADEYEKNYRRVLNYGHSFGHSLEAITNHQIPHGLAVAWGMDLINFIAMRRTYISEEKFERIHRFVKKNLPFKLSNEINPDSLIQGAMRDKKAGGGCIDLVFLTQECKLKIINTVFDEILKQDIYEYLERKNVYC